MKAMKALLMLGAMLALTACSNEDDTITAEPTTGTDTTAQTIKFNLTASHPDDGAAQTRAVKAGWESGDAIFVFFSGAAAPKHLKMTFDGTAWTSAEYDGATQTDGALGLKNGDTGSMRAVFLPFGSTATVSADDTAFKFSTDYYTYYATATLDYTVTDNTVSGAFSMTIPTDYVQFFVEDAAATNGAYTLATDAVKPTAIASIAADGTITEQQGSAGDDMLGYAYSGGYLFSGKLTTWTYGSNYYFAKTKTADNTRADYFVTGKTLESHSAVKLPANDNVYSASNTSGKWIPVGSGITVNMGNVAVNAMFDESLGKWQTCNQGATKPEEVGTLYTYDEAMALGVNIASKYTFDKMLAQLSWTWLSVNGKQGVVVKAKDTNGFIFLPETSTSSDAHSCYYWTSTAAGDNDNKAYILKYDFIENEYSTYSRVKYSTYPVRAFT